MTKYLLMMLVPLFLLTACFDRDEKETPKGSLLDGHQQAMDKAKGLDKVIQEGIEKRQQGER